MAADITTLIGSIKNRRVLIAGDLVADQFLSGTISRVSREAPVFILRHDDTETRPGSAANAAANVASLGGDPILLGAVGNDNEGKLLLDALGSAGVPCEHVLPLLQRTTTKVRVLAGQHYAARQQVIRIDYENHELDSATEDEMLRRLASSVHRADAIVLSDYGYGIVSPRFFEAARDAAAQSGIPLIVDSRFRLGSFTSATSATPNQEEAEGLLGRQLDEAGCLELRERLGLRALLVTRGNKGMILCEENSKPKYIPAAGSLEPVDVTGAGDTVIAAYSLAIAAGLSFSEAAAIANHAGGIVVMKKGTAAASFEELETSLATIKADPAAVSLEDTPR